MTVPFPVGSGLTVITGLTCGVASRPMPCWAKKTGSREGMAGSHHRSRFGLEENGVKVGIKPWLDFV